MAKSDAGHLLACLREFADKKPRSIELFFTYQGLKKPSTIERMSSFARMLAIYQANPDSLKDLVLVDRWLNRSSGTVYSSNECFKASEIEPMLSSIVKGISTETSTPFRLRSFYNSPSGLLVLLYRQDQGRLLESYDGPLDFVGRKAVLFRVAGDGPVAQIEVRCDLVSVREALIKTISGITKIAWSERTDFPYTSYEAEDILSVVRTGGVDRSLTVLGMEFGSVDLRSPNTRITLESDEDVGDSVTELSTSFGPLTNIKSLLDLRRIRIRVPDNDGERTIAVKQLDSGAVSFVLDDRKLLPETVSKIAAGFLARFKLPLNTPIDHSKFAVGEARGLDSVFATDYEQNVPGFQKALFGELLAKGLIKQKVTCIKRCKACGLEVRDGSSGRCRRCGQAMEDDQEVTQLVPDEGKVRDSAFELLNKVPGWKTVEKNGEVTIEGEKYAVFRAKPRKSPPSGNTQLCSVTDVLIYVTHSVPASSTVERFQRYRDPIYIVYVGKAALARQRDRLAKLHGDTLGELIVKAKNDTLESTAHELEEAVRSGNTRLSAAIQTAQERVRRLIAEGKPEPYDDRLFEDDCWALLRSVVEYTQKWGADKLQKPLPDGYIDLDYSVGGGDEFISTWTYDAKLTEQSEGYDLGQAERRKMHEYLNRALASHALNPKLSLRKYRGHILVSNRFRPDQIPKITEYLRTTCRSLVRKGAKVRYLDAEALLRMSQVVGMRESDWRDRRNILLEAFDGLFDRDDPHITVKDVEEALARAIAKPAERPTLNPEVVAKDFLE